MAIQIRSFGRRDVNHIRNAPGSYALKGLDTRNPYIPPYPPVAPPSPAPPAPTSFLISGIISHTGTTFSAGVEVQDFGTIFADAVTGSYGVVVPAGYNGSVIPHFCSGDWTPASQTYTNVLANQSNQDYDLVAITDINTLEWTSDNFFLGQLWDGTVGVAGNGTVYGATGSYWSFAIGDGDGFAHINTFEPTIRTTLVNFDAPYLARIQVDYTGSQFTTNTSGGVANSDSILLVINGTQADFVTNVNGSFGGLLFVDGLIEYGCNDLHMDIGNSTGLSNTPPQWFYAAMTCNISITVI